MLLNANSAVVVDIGEDIAFGQCPFSFYGRDCINLDGHRIISRVNTDGAASNRRLTAQYIHNPRAPTALAPSL